MRIAVSSPMREGRQPVSVVTGAARGLGLAITRELVSRGWRVIAVHRDDGEVSDLARLGLACVPIRADIRSPECPGVIASTIDGPFLDLLINNAGIVEQPATLAQFALENVQTAFDTHCLATLSLTKGLLGHLAAASRPAVVNVTSRWGSLDRSSEMDVGQYYGYRISKAALNMATLCMVSDLAADGIAVAAIHPGSVNTRISSSITDFEPHEAAARLVDFALTVEPGLANPIVDLSPRRVAP